MAGGEEGRGSASETTMRWLGPVGGLWVGGAVCVIYLVWIYGIYGYGFYDVYLWAFMIAITCVELSMMGFFVGREDRRMH
jgi:hypothetical protein